MKLLPAYVKRGRLEEKVVLVAISKETLEEAFTYLKERLDPEEDIFDSAARFRAMTWIPEPFQDFFARYLEEAFKAGVTAKTACILMVSQVPPEARIKLKEWIIPKGNDMSVEDALQFSTVVRKTLTEKGIPVSKGLRVQVIKERIGEKEASQENPESANSSSSETPSSTVQTIRYKRTTADKRRSEPLKCYACGSSNHLVRFCPSRPCFTCGNVGHRPYNCPRRSGNRSGDEKLRETRKPRVLQLSSGEEYVTVQIKIGSHKVAAMLNTGAKPSVIDYDTAVQIDLAGKLIPTSSRIVFGLCSNLVKVQGYVDAPICIGDLQPITERKF